MSISFIVDDFFPGLGKGLHSEAGKVKFRPALEQLCNEFVQDPGPSHLVYSRWSIVGMGIHTPWILGTLVCLLFNVNAKDLEHRVSCINVVT
jgi:hypothetical protein